MERHAGILINYAPRLLSQSKPPYYYTIGLKSLKLEKWDLKLFDHVIKRIKSFHLFNFSSVLSVSLSPIKKLII